jgi:hypothetical protein
VIEAGRLREVVGKTLLGRSGVRIGRVTQVYEGTGGEGTFATVKTGLFGNHSSFVPLADAELHGDNVHVPYPKELIDGAPRVADEQELGPAEEDRLFAHYGLTGAAPAAAPAAGRPRATAHDALGGAAARRHRAGRDRPRAPAQVRRDRDRHADGAGLARGAARRARAARAGRPGVPEVDALSEEVHEVVLSAERPWCSARSSPSSASGWARRSSRARRRHRAGAQGAGGGAVRPPGRRAPGCRPGPAARDRDDHAHRAVPRPREDEPSDGTTTTSELFSRRGGSPATGGEPPYEATSARRTTKAVAAAGSAAAPNPAASPYRPLLAAL